MKLCLGKSRGALSSIWCCFIHSFGASCYRNCYPFTCCDLRFGGSILDFPKTLGINFVSVCSIFNMLSMLAIKDLRGILQLILLVRWRRCAQNLCWTTWSTCSRNIWRIFCWTRLKAPRLFGACTAWGAKFTDSLSYLQLCNLFLLMDIIYIYIWRFCCSFSHLRIGNSRCPSQL